MSEERIARAVLLAQQHRLDDAERELRAALVDDPNDAFALALLATVVAQSADVGANDGGNGSEAAARATERLDEAERCANAAVGADPALDYAHHARAQVLLSRGRHDDAHNAACEATRLDPADASHRRLLARIAVAASRWQDAVRYADEALTLDPEDADASSLRAIALTHLGRHDDARTAAVKALADDPGSTLTHTARGWSALHAGDVDTAITHFKEALRLHPENEAAKLGMAEALKGRSRFVRWILASRLWMARLSARAQIGLIIGLWIGQRVLRQLARQNPALAPWVSPILWAYGIFVFLSWTWTPLTDVILRLTPYGRNLLTRDRISASNWVGGLLAGAIAGLVPGFTLSGRFAEGALLAGFACLLLIPAVASVFSTPRGWARVVMSIVAWTLAGVAAGGLALLAFGGERHQETFDTLAMSFVYGVIGSTWLGSFLQFTPSRR